MIQGFSTDSGVVGDSITSDSTPTLTLTAEPGSVVEIFQNGVSVGFAVEGTGLHAGVLPGLGCAG